MPTGGKSPFTPELSVPYRLSVLACRRRSSIVCDSPGVGAVPTATFTAWRLHRASVKADLRMARVLKQLNVEDVSDDDVENAMDEE